MRLFPLFVALVLASYAAAADTPVVIAPPPVWIAASETPAITPTPTEQSSYGYDYLLLDRQISLRTQSTYNHTVYRITAGSTLQSGSRLDWSYDPAYEKFTLNHLRVIRDGVTQDRLRPDAVKTIQQESDLDRHMLNGRLTALVMLDDIRVGDVIDYAVTFEGWNPAFAGRFYNSIYTTWSVPVRHQRFRLIVPAGRTVQHQEVGAVPLKLTTTTEGDTNILTWEGRDLKPLASEKETPGWFDAYSYLQFTESARWSDVVKWAEPFYAITVRPDDPIHAKAAALTAGLESANDKAVALLRFAQQDVRYLGMELGAGCYKPTPPADVLAQRFGDCKGKTLLFCSLMRAVGLTAYPALLNTDYRDKIDTWLPSAQAFDHVIAAIPKPDGGYWWVDPTRTNQQGDLGCRGLPDYRRALVVRSGETGLTSIDLPPAARRSMDVEETFNVAAFDQPAGFRVVTRYTGTSADATRRYFAETTPDQITKDYINYYNSAYPGLIAAKPALFTEDTRRNLVTVEENYTVPKLWEPQTGKKGVKAFFYPKPISDYATRPDAPVRTMPLAVDHPVNVTLKTTVNLHKTWHVTPSNSVTEDDAFRAGESISGEGKIVVMNYSWRSLADHVPAARVADHVAKINRYRDTLGYELTYTDAVPAAPTPPAPFRLNWMLTFVSFVTVAVLVFLATRVYAYRFTTPPPLEPGPQLVGLSRNHAVEKSRRLGTD
ncbi:MAG: DUF3857 and transglutaminase domain-containing protein [Opitutaceae bacterium]|jgi:transglutaminase-like putative cysteine protease